MKKCNKDLVGHVCDNVMWYLIYLLPLICLLIIWCRGSYVPLSEMFSMLGLTIFNDNIVLTTLTDVLGVGGVFPIFVDNSLLIYMSYFILVFVVHIMVDIVLYLLRVIHHTVNHGLGGASHE